MPLDSTNWSRTTERETKPDLSKPSLEGLSWLLRHPEEWPSNHRWAFDNRLHFEGCGTVGCALGIVERKWGIQLYPHFLGMTDKDFCEVFGIGLAEFLPSYGTIRSLVTASQVADRIDEFLRSRNSDAYLAETRK